MAQGRSGGQKQCIRLRMGPGRALLRRMMGRCSMLMARESSKRAARSSSASGWAAIRARHSFLWRRYSQLQGATSRYRAWPCMAATLPPHSFRSMGCTSGSWLPASRKVRTPARSHCSSSRARRARACSRHSQGRVSARSPLNTKVSHPLTSPGSSPPAGKQQRSCPRCRSETKRTRSPGSGSWQMMVGMAPVIYYPRWRTASYRHTPVATDTFRQGTLPSMGMRIRKSQFSSVRRRMPSPSAPITSAMPPFRSMS